jgi:hypothetical protein
MTDETKKLITACMSPPCGGHKRPFGTRSMLKRYGVGTQPHKQAGHMTAPDQCCTV